MKFRYGCFLLMFSVTISCAVAADPTIRPATMPTAAELIKMMQDQAAQKDALPKVAYFDLTQGVSEKPSDFSLFGDDRTITLQSLVDRLNKARDDKDLKAILITIGSDHPLNIAQAQEVRVALLDLQKAGKKTFIYADSYDTVGYIVASGCDEVCLLEGGDITIPGVGIETMFYKGGMDKLGVEADYIQIGEYKGADEAYTRSGASDELKGELNKLTGSLYDEIISSIATGRKISPQEVQKVVDDTMISAETAKQRGLVDELIDQDGLRDLLKSKLGGDINLVKDYAAPEKREVDYSNIFSFFSSITKKDEESSKPQVALVYADGEIVDGDQGDSILSGDQVGSEHMRKVFRMLLRDPNVKAVVLRIDSPGGSALGSEVMWQGLHRLAEKKPVIISVGSMAASGGYYLASAGNYIFADPASIVGSIGVVGGKFVTKDLFDKLGLTTESFSKGHNADLFSSNQKFTDSQKEMVRKWMQETYNRFTQRVLTNRGDKIKDIDKVARGRIFTARQAKDLGMVDELGGANAAILYAVKQANLESGNYDVRVFPQPKTLADLLGGRDSELESATPIRPETRIAANVALQMMPSSLRQLVIRQVSLAQMLEKHPVVLVSPFVVTTK